MLKISETHFNNFVQWGNDRNIFNGSTVNTQVMKSLSECGELCDHIAKGKYELCEDDIGDIAVTLVMIAGCAGNLDILRNGQLDFTSGLNSIETSAAMVAWSISVIPSAISAASEVNSSVCGHLPHLLHTAVMALVDLSNKLTDIGTPMTLDSCCAKAWDDIKGRKGVMFNGTFIKESDPLYSSCLAELRLS